MNTPHTQYAQGAPSPTTPCGRCGHDHRWHADRVHCMAYPPLGEPCTCPGFVDPANVTPDEPGSAEAGA